ncbi:MAG: SMI1/KNR4 family protein [Gammaproteobacteria bacterium]|nr:SMI1/KNR4 family protein [Gammaproteobacteria bacterium]
MNNLAEYKDLWADIQSKYIRMRELASVWKEDRYARRSYQCPFGPTVPLKLINEFEARNKIELPLSYKSYLLYFGATGPSDFGCIYDFVSRIYHEDVSTPSLLEIFENPVDIDCDDDSEPHPIASGDGTVEIAPGFNPSVPFLVLNGEASGYVYWWNFGDMVGCLGDFAVWQMKVSDKHLAFVEKEHAMFATPIGMSRDELLELYSGEVYHEDIDGIEYLHHKKTRTAFILDQRGYLTSIQKRGPFIEDLRSKRQSSE